MIDITQFDMFLNTFSSNDVLNNNNVWENIFIVLTSGDDGSLDKVSCSFPFEGEQTVLPTADGDIMPDEQRSSVLDG